jgi:hypothetical protein
MSDDTMVELQLMRDRMMALGRRAIDGNNVAYGRECLALARECQQVIREDAEARLAEARLAELESVDHVARLEQLAGAVRSWRNGGGEVEQILAALNVLDQN